MSYTDLLTLKSQNKTSSKPAASELQPEPADAGRVAHHETNTISADSDTNAPVSDPIAVVRRAVKHFGKEQATYRLTTEEKNQLDEIEYAYKKRYRIKTTENEITRIAVNYLLQDYREKGENSILHQVLQSLNN